MDITGPNLDACEARRLAALTLYEAQTVDEAATSEPDDTFDRYTALAASMFSVPIAIISMVGADTIRFKSRFGIGLDRLPRPDTFCNATIQSDHPLIVPDTAEDSRFATCELVTGPTSFRFYGGAPLITADGYRIGSFSLIDTKPRPDFAAREAAMLGELARSVMAELELRRRFAEKNDLLTELSFRQDLADIAAHAPNLTTALDRILNHVGNRLDSSYCALPEADMATATYRYIAAYAVDDRFAQIFRENHQVPARSVVGLSYLAALTGNVLVDSGPLENADEIGQYPSLQGAVRLGTRRQIALPLPIADRHFALMIGFRTTTICPRVMDVCEHFADWVVPLLQGRLREDALARSNALLDRSNRALQTLLACNEAIASATDEASLTQAICDRAVSAGRYGAVWVGMAEHDANRSLYPVATSGSGLENIRQVQISWADTPHGRGPSGTAVRESRPVAVSDLMNNPAIAPWRSDARRAGYTAGIALPLRVPDGATFGCLTLYANDRGDGLPGHNDSFDADEIRLLSQLASNLAFGILALRTRSARDTALAARQSSEQRLAQLLESSPTVIYALEQRGHETATAKWVPVEFSANLERLFGHRPEIALGPDWWSRNLHPADRDAAYDEERRLLKEGRLVHRYRFARADGTFRWVRDEKTVIFDEAGRPRKIVGAWVDITDKHQADEEIHRLAYSDVLTGLPNRAMLHRLFQTELDHAARTSVSGAVLVIDLNGFKSINDLHGQATGDIVLDQVGRRLTSALRAKDVVARLGGDEFVVLLGGLADQAGRAAEVAHGIAEKLHQALTEPIQAATHECHVGASIGIAMFPQATAGIDDILRQADIAMCQAKTGEQTRTMFFEPAMHDQVAHRHTIGQALREALENDRFEVWLQSQVDRQGTVVGAEALIRLRCADGTIVPPGEFIPVAEETGIVVPMGLWMLRQVCGIVAARRCAGQPLRISINVSPRQFRDPGFICNIETVLAETGANPRDLMIEITEGVLIDRIEETSAKLNTLAARGIRFSVDDFGTGYSSLGYLQNLPIAEIKIDRSFIQRLPDCMRDVTLAEAILAMTRHLGLIVVAEGVETEAQADFLRARLCDIMQGYLFGRPEPASVWLERCTGLLV